MLTGHSLSAGGPRSPSCRLDHPRTGHRDLCDPTLGAMKLPHPFRDFIAERVESRERASSLDPISGMQIFSTVRICDSLKYFAPHALASRASDDEMEECDSRCSPIGFVIAVLR